MNDHIRTRRAAMLDELLFALAQVHRRRRRRRTALAATAALLVTAGLSLLALPPAPPPLIAENLPLRSHLDYALLRTDPAVLERYRPRPSRHVLVIDDDELLLELAAIDRPAGLIRRGGRAWLTADVLGPDPSARLHAP